MRVLIAEDEPVNRLQLSRTLASWGHEVVQAADGAAAWEILQREKIRFLISDWMMPGMDGPALCRKIREAGRPFYTYVILLTALAEKSALVEGLEAGADDFVVKPFNREELNVRIRAGERVLRLEADLEERNDRLLQAYDAAHRDLEAAAEMQKSLLPAAGARTPGLRFASLFAPSGFVAGDIFNVFALNERQSGFYLLDVAGHGVASAMLSFTLSKMLTPSTAPDSIVRRALPGPGEFEATPPAAVVTELNARFEDAQDAMKYFTMIYGLIEPDRDRIRLVQAGHPPPIVQTAAGTVTVGESGYPVGMLAGVEFEEEAAPFAPGDRIFLYSDGITECPSKTGEPFGAERLIELIEAGRAGSIDETVAATGRVLRDWNGGGDFKDDVTLLALERLP